MEQELYLEKYVTENLKLSLLPKEQKESLFLIWEYLQDVGTLTIQDIINIHSILEGILPEENDIRRDTVRYKDFVFCDDYKMLLAKLQNWVDFANQPLSKNLTDDAKIKCLFYRHIEFGVIHPLASGNGVIGRMLLLWGMEKYHAPIYVFNSEKIKEYESMFVNYNNEIDDKVGIRFDAFMTYEAPNPCIAV